MKYINGIEQLQYDILYGERYCYENGETPYPPTDIVMGIEDVVINDISLSEDGTQYIITGENFTRWSRVYINDTKLKPVYLSGTQLAIDVGELESGDIVVISQVGSNSTRFRDSNEYAFMPEPVTEDIFSINDTETTEEIITTEE